MHGDAGIFLYLVRVRVAAGRHIDNGRVPAAECRVRRTDAIRTRCGRGWGWLGAGAAKCWVGVERIIHSTSSASKARHKRRTHKREARRRRRRRFDVDDWFNYIIMNMCALLVCLRACVRVCVCARERFARAVSGKCHV